MIHCKIKFDDNKWGSYYAGATINGRVELILEQPYEVRGIHLLVGGKAYAFFRDYSPELRTAVVYERTEKYIDSSIPLLKSEEGTDRITLEPGKHEYSFSCTLPQKLPSSVEGKTGYVRYTAKVVFERPWTFDNKFTAAFTVVTVTDLNDENLDVKNPVTCHVDKSFWSFPHSKPINVDAAIPKGGFVPGEIIPVTVTLHNEHHKNIKDIEVFLVQTIVSHSDEPLQRTEKEKRTISKVTLYDIHNEPQEIVYFKLPIPPIPPTYGSNICNIIRVYYKIHVKVVPTGPHASPIIKIPVFIGTVPLTEPSDKSAETDSVSNFDPAYEEADYLKVVNLNEDNRHAIAKTSYLPVYPVFTSKNP